MKQECVNLLEDLGEEDRVAVYTFDGYVRKISDFIPVGDAIPLVEGINQHNGMTSIYDAVQTALNDFSKLDSTDGNHFIDLLKFRHCQRHQHVEDYIGTPPLSAKNAISLALTASENLPGFKLNNWYDWQELIKSHAWNFVHNAVESDIVACDSSIEKEVTIQGAGRCDLLKRSRKEIWEVKPSSYVKPEKMKKALAQLERYVNAYGGYFGGPEIPDRSFTIADYVVSYYNLQNGLILYRFEKEKKQEAVNPVPNVAYEPQENSDTAKMVMKGIAVLVIAGTLAEDVFSGGAGIVDDAASIAFAYQLIQ